MAEITVGPESPEQPDSRARMAAFTLQSRVCPQERKPVYMTVYVLSDLTPAADSVTVFAIGAQLAAMNIGMTVGTLGSDIGKNQVEMAMGTIDVFVHFFKGETGCPMIEIRRRTNGLPARSGMTVVA